MNTIVQLGIKWEINLIKMSGNKVGWNALIKTVELSEWVIYLFKNNNLFRNKSLKCVFMSGNCIRLLPDIVYSVFVIISSANTSIIPSSLNLFVPYSNILPSFKYIMLCSFKYIMLSREMSNRQMYSSLSGAWTGGPAV